MSLEQVGYGLIFLLTIGLRLFQLGDAPLSSAEALEAMAAWRFVHPQLPALAPSSPLVFAGTSVAFALLGASDFAARLVPALAGIGLVLLPILFRPYLGRGGALILAALLAVSPSFTYASRILNPAIPALFWVGLAFGAGLDFWRTGQRRWSITAAVALAAALATGSLTYSALVSLSVAALVAWDLAPVERKNIWKARWVEVRQTPGIGLHFGLALAASLFFLATLGAWFPAGLASAGDALTRWLNGFFGAAGQQPLLALQLLVLYEPLLLLMGVGGLIWLVVARHPARYFLLIWLVIGLALALLRQGASPADVLVPAVPLAVAAALGLAHTLEALADVRDHWLLLPVMGVMIVLATWMALLLAAYPDKAAFAPGDLRVALALMVVLISLAVVGIGTIMWDRSTWPAPVLGLAVILLIYTWGSGWGLSHMRSTDPREPWVVDPTTAGVHSLVRTLQDASRNQLGMPSAIDVSVQAPPDGVLAWYLRDFRTVHFIDQIPPGLSSSAVIVPAQENKPQLGATYQGSAFALTATPPAGPLSPEDELRWLAFRGGPPAQPTGAVILWIQQPGAAK